MRHRSCFFTWKPIEAYRRQGFCLFETKPGAGNRIQNRSVLTDRSVPISQLGWYSNNSPFSYTHSFHPHIYTTNYLPYTQMEVICATSAVAVKETIP